MLLSRDYYIGHPVDDSDKFEEKMNEILGEDDANKVHEYLKGYDSKYLYPGLLDMCLDRLATECALHIIQGKLPHGHPYLGSDHLEPLPDVPVLYQVIHNMCEPHVFTPLLNDCKAATQVNIPFEGLLPLHWLLDLLVELPPFSCWSPGQPLSTIIDSLFLPEIIPKLECARMLAQHTHSLDQIALAYIQNGEIIPLAALLLVAPFTKGDFETIKSYTSVASHAIHDQSVTPSTYCAAAALVYIFDKDSDKLISKFNNLQKGTVQAADGDQSIVNHFNQQTSNVNFERRLFSKSSQMTGRTGVNEMMCHDDANEIRVPFAVFANISSNHCLLLYSLLCEREGKEKLLQSQVGLTAVISAIRALCNNNGDAMEHFNSHDAHYVNLVYMRLLHLLLGSLVKYDYLSKWSPGQSLVKLLLLMFLQRELRPTLECTQLVAERTNSVNEVAWKLIQQGELIQLAGLLLVARKKAMEPFDSGDTIKEATSMNIVSQAFYGESVTATMGAAGLFEIFEKAGDTLAKYWSIHNDEHEPVGVIVEVATRMQDSGIQLLSADVDLTDIYSASSHPEMLKSICERLGLSQTSRKSLFPSVKSVKERCRPEVPVCYDFMMDMAMAESRETWLGDESMC